MKKILQIQIMLIVVLGFFTGSANAQLNGTYTIGSSSVFTSLQSAVDSISTVGVSGPVTFEIDSGTYVESVFISAIPSTSATNTITFKSKSDSASYVTVYGSVYLSGADFITFKSLTIEASAFNAVSIQNGADYITLDSCIVKGRNINTNNRSYDAIAGSVTSDESYTTIKNCTVYNGSCGIYLVGKSSGSTERGHIVENNRIYGCYVHSLGIARSDSAIIRNNYIESNTNNIQKNACGIILNTCYNSVISSNRVNVKKHGIRIHNCQSKTDSNYVFNNQIICKYNAVAFYAYPLYLSNGNKNLFVYNNSFYKLYHASYGAVQSSYNGGDENIHLVNNVFSSLSVSTSAIFYSPSDVYYIAHNIFSDASGEGNIYINNRWQKVSEISGTLIGDNNYNYNPMFVSNNDLHISNGLLGNLGTPLELVTKDINGETRNTQTPDIGAYEFDPEFQKDIAVTSASLGQFPYCSAPENIILNLKNIGAQSISSVQVERSFNSEVLDTVNYDLSLDSYQVGEVTVTYPNFQDGDTVAINIVSVDGLVDSSSMNNSCLFEEIYLAMSGNQVVSDSATFDSIFNALNTRGICGSMEIVIEPGVYNNKISLNEIAGSSQLNTLTVRSSDGNPNSVVLAPESTGGSVIDIKGSDYISFRDFTVIADKLNGISYSGGSDYLTFNNLNIVADSLGNYDGIYSSDDDDHFTTIKNCRIEFGENALNINGDYGEDNTVIINNTLLNFSDYGIYVSDQNSLRIEGNTIINDSSNSCDGMDIYNIYENLILTNNQVYIDSTSGVGADIEYFYGSGAKRSYISNNVFSIGGRPWAGFYFYEVVNTSLHNNTVTFSSTANNDYALYIDYFSILDIRNNTVTVSEGATAVYLDDLSGVTYMDYNNIYAEDGAIVKFDGKLYSLLEDWQKFGWDQHSISVDPMLQDRMIPCNLTLNNAGVFAEDLLATDLLGKPRSINTPDIGAVEISRNGVSLGEDFCLCETPVKLDAGPGASSYSWNTGGTTQTIQINEPGTYFVETTGICNTTGVDTIVISSSELAASFDFEVLENNVVALYNTSTGNISDYIWDYETGTSYQENALAIFESEGSYTVQLEVSNICKSEVVEKTIDISYTGINDALANKNINVFPNPVEKQLNISFESEGAQNTLLKIIDINGKLYKTFTMHTVVGKNYFTADLSGLPSGAYFIVLNNDSSYKIYKK